MSKEEERLFLEPFFHKATTGDIATEAEIKEALEEYVGKSLHHSVVYRFLDRNVWRKVKPRPAHVQGNKEVREDFKKNPGQGKRHSGCKRSEGSSAGNYHGSG
jgi:transposase